MRCTLALPFSWGHWARVSKPQCMLLSEQSQWLHHSALLGHFIATKTSYKKKLSCGKIFFFRWSSFAVPTKLQKGLRFVQEGKQCLQNTLENSFAFQPHPPGYFPPRWRLWCSTRLLTSAFPIYCKCSSKAGSERGEPGRWTEQGKESPHCSSGGWEENAAKNRPAHFSEDWEVFLNLINSFNEWSLQGIKRLTE